MAKPSPMRLATLSDTERREPTVMIVVRVPWSWREALRRQGIISDKLLKALVEHVRPTSAGG